MYTLLFIYLFFGWEAKKTMEYGQMHKCGSKFDMIASYWVYEICALMGPTIAGPKWASLAHGFGFVERLFSSNHIIKQSHVMYIVTQLS